MCLYCHSRLTDDSILKSLQNQINNPYPFNQWNSTSLAHISYSVMGLNGIKCQKLALSILNDYIEWAKTQSDHDTRIPQTGCEKMPPLTDIINMYTLLSSLHELFVQDGITDTREALNYPKYKYFVNEMTNVSLHQQIPDYWFYYVNKTKRNSQKLYEHCYNTIDSWTIKQRILYSIYSVSLGLLLSLSIAYY